jgi:hypothetical protein
MFEGIVLTREFNPRVSTSLPNLLRYQVQAVWVEVDLMISLQDNVLRSVPNPLGLWRATFESSFAEMA